MNYKLVLSGGRKGVEGLLSGKIVEQVEHSVPVAETDAGPRFLRNVPGQFRLISFEALIERRVNQSVRGCWRGRVQRSQQRARFWIYADVVNLTEGTVLRNAVGPKVKFLDQANMLS